MDVTPAIHYHLVELDLLARHRDEPGALPGFSTDDHAVLDIGCGIGQTYVVSGLGPDRFLVGLDVDDASLRYGRARHPHIHFVHGSGERLPFADASFDRVVSRVSLPYTRLDLALAEIHRVLRPGGSVWATLHPCSMTLRDLGTALSEGRLRNAAYLGWRLINGGLLHLTGRVLPMPGTGRYDSFQTADRTHRMLRKAGFDACDFALWSTRALFCASKPVAPVTSAATP